MIRSMTGFGAAEGDAGGVRVSVEVRAVNHRFFNPTIKLPAAFARWEGEVREAMRRSVARGHVTLSARIDRAPSGDGVIDEERFAKYVNRLRELQQRYGLGEVLDVATVLRLPAVVAAEEPGDIVGTSGGLVAIVEQALAALDAMRCAEGGRLASYVEERLDAIGAAVGRIGERAPRRLVEQRERLRAAVRELADGIAMDEPRLAQEVAVLADRLDVGEEIARFGSHLHAFRVALGERNADGVGKRLGFLLQELLREANTTGSKANDAAMVQDVLLIKEELERIREQVENLE